MIRRGLLLVIMALPLSLAGQESPEPSDEARAEQAEETQSEGESDERPDSDSLRKREISEAFERFKPSEEISADNAVPFPTDI